MHRLFDWLETNKTRYQRQEDAIRGRSRSTSGLVSICGPAFSERLGGEETSETTVVTDVAVVVVSDMAISSSSLSFFSVSGYFMF